MTSRATSFAELKERLRLMQQRIANAKLDRRVMEAQMETLALEIMELEECEAALMRSLAGRESSRQHPARGR